MTTKRIIPCLDIRNGKVVKGINFKGIKELGDPLDYAIKYFHQGASEIVLLDIAGTVNSREFILDIVRDMTQSISIPITVGGGIASVEDINDVLNAGAHRVGISSAAVRNPQFIFDASKAFGNDKIVVAIDAKSIGNGKYCVATNGGKIITDIDAIDWAKKMQELGAGEILLTSMDADGTKSGYDIELLNAVCNAIDIPVIASGGCGELSHFYDVFEKTAASAALAASLFHYDELTVGEVLDFLKKKGINIKR